MAERSDSAEFRRAQDEFFAQADAEHFAWQTQAPYLAESEAALLEAVAPAERLLEIGCGEGANLFHVRTRCGKAVGMDRSFHKVRFARTRLPHAGFVCADAAFLPVREGAFDAVLIRDLLHHVPDRPRTLAEASRALGPGGTLTVLEPNARNPLVWLQGILVAEERQAWRSTARRLADELRAAGFAEPDLSERQPLPVHRVALHYRYGRPSLGALAGVRRLLDGLDAVVRRVLPRAAWLYLVARARKSRDAR
jgi:SAM-dependent methyltransferase